MDYEDKDGDIYDFYAEYYRSKARLMDKLRERHHMGRHASRSRPSNPESQQLVYVQGKSGEPLLPALHQLILVS